MQTRLQKNHSQSTKANTLPKTTLSHMSSTTTLLTSVLGLLATAFGLGIYRKNNK